MSTTSNSTVSITLPAQPGSAEKKDLVFNLYHQNGYPPMREAVLEKFRRLGGEHEVVQILGYGGTSVISASEPFTTYGKALDFIKKVKLCKAAVVTVSGFNRDWAFNIDGPYLCTDIKCSLRGARQGSYIYLVQVEFELSI
jgi:hypothetical protein